MIGDEHEKEIFSSSWLIGTEPAQAGDSTATGAVYGSSYRSDTAVNNLDRLFSFVQSRGI